MESRPMASLVVEHVHEELEGLLVLSRAASAVAPGRVETSLRQHETLVAAVLRRDGDAAKADMRGHVESALLTAIETRSQTQCR